MSVKAHRPISSFTTAFGLPNTSFACKSVRTVEAEPKEPKTVERSGEEVHPCAKAPLPLVAPKRPSELNCVTLPQTEENNVFQSARVNCEYGLGQRSRPSMYPRLATYLNFVNLSEVSGVEFQSILNHSPGSVCLNPHESSDRAEERRP